MSRDKVLVLLVALMVGSGMLRSEEKQPEPDRGRRALERSLLFPGLGQLGEKQYVKAALFASAELFCLAQVVIQARRGDDAYWKYRGAQDMTAAQEWRRQTERLDRRRNAAIAAAASVWVLNMVDIFVHAKKKYGRGKSLAVRPFYHSESHAYGVGIACHF